MANALMEFHKNEQSSVDEFNAAYLYAKKIALFKSFWRQNYGYITLTLDADEIYNFIASSKTIAQAADRASDYLLASGIAEVQE